MKTHHRIALIGAAGLLVAGFVYAQMYMHQKSREELEEIARELALTWQKELNLDYEQTRQMEDAIIEYTIKKNEILNSGIKQDSLIRRLQAVQRNEHKKLQSFLDEHQFENYLSLNKKITRKA